MDEIPAAFGSGCFFDVLVNARATAQKLFREYVLALALDFPVEFGDLKGKSETLVLYGVLFWFGDDRSVHTP